MIAVIIESRYEIRVVKICRKLRETVYGQEATVRNVQERKREKVLYVNYANLRDCSVAIYGRAPRGSRCSCCDLPEKRYRAMTTCYKYQRDNCVSITRPHINENDLKAKEEMQI